jgi:hypothetical protein
LSNYPGETQVMIYNEKLNKKFLANNMYWVTPNPALSDAMENLLGEGTVKIVKK